MKDVMGEEAHMLSAAIKGYRRAIPRVTHRCSAARLAAAFSLC